MYCVTVDFTIKPGAMEAFLPRMRQQRDDSLTLEEGCTAFEIWTAEAHPDRVFLYEIYTSADAFEDHLASDHFHSFAVAVERLVEARVLCRWEKLV
ncbi:MAG: antibiotic biosynthesis monooxygenase [Pseudomonadota bacterium]